MSMTAAATTWPTASPTTCWWGWRRTPSSSRTGDNDTFPLWYLQEVENFRKDVRVICLSLLNTEWCIRQIRDFPPKVPVTLNDTEIKLMEPELVNGRVMMVKDKMVQHIIKANNWQRPIYSSP